jgi:hypothetical protein
VAPSKSAAILRSFSRSSFSVVTQPAPRGSVQHRREHGDGLWETRALLARLQLFLEDRTVGWCFG